MFGQQNNQPANDQIPDQSIDGVLSDAVASDQTTTFAEPTVSPVSPQTMGTPVEDWQHPGLPLDSDKAAAVQAAVPKPSYSNDSHNDEPTFAANDLIDIKQQALSQLSPLVGHLDQSPEEKFKTTMMMIQASDDQTLVRTAHEAAMQIEDEKVRAQALLDIVNEINYFTAHHTEA